ncbi:uncharacterized protein LOC121309998 isoform X2 [Polyodon spathula]|uniref:uncharacterized protein LOC121309998 isoform X2 n=1 Tax=Polyodon spathula TaxID=7913 RepID=UPI001B7F11FD|nr:uncharacterized protein LOC121309998 isoform X2 [Polyodon spathula]
MSFTDRYGSILISHGQWGLVYSFNLYTTVEISYVLFCFHLGKQVNNVIGVCLVTVELALIILGLCLLYDGVSVNMTIKSNFGFGILVFTLLIVLVIQFFFSTGFKDFTIPIISTVFVLVKIVGFIIVVVGFSISVAAKDCTTQYNSYNCVIGGLVIFAIGEIVDMALWIKGDSSV